MGKSLIEIGVIGIGDRIRKDMGNLQSLADSMKEHGLLHPIVITPDKRLLCGQRRLEAARLLGWKEIRFTEVSVANLLKAERDENVIRKDLTPTEKVAIGRLLEEREKPKAAQRSGGRPGKGDKTAGETPEVPKGNVRDIVGKAVGMGGTKYQQAKAVVAAAEENQEKDGDLPEMMDETGSVRGAHQEMKRRQGGNGRHPVHRNKRHLKPEEALTKALNSLDGILIALDPITPIMMSQIKRERAKDIGSQFIALARRFSKFGRRLRDEQERTREG